MKTVRVLTEEPVSVKADASVHSLIELLNELNK